MTNANEKQTAVNFFEMLGTLNRAEYALRQARLDYRASRIERPALKSIERKTELQRLAFDAFVDMECR